MANRTNSLSGAELYPAGGTANSPHDVRVIGRAYPVFAAMQETGPMWTSHGELQAVHRMLRPLMIP